MTDITRTILLQLGGGHFTTCVGAKNLYEINNGTGLQLDFMRNPSKANRLRIIYDLGTDTYTMQFFKKGLTLTTRNFMKYKYEEIKKKSEPTLIKEVTECYCDDLRRIFENTTKLRTSLTHIYADI